MRSLNPAVADTHTHTEKHPPHTHLNMTTYRALSWDPTIPTIPLHCVAVVAVRSFSDDNENAVSTATAVAATAAAAATASQDAPNDGEVQWVLHDASVLVRPKHAPFGGAQSLVGVRIPTTLLMLVLRTQSPLVIVMGRPLLLLATKPPVVEPRLLLVHNIRLLAVLLFHHRIIMLTRSHCPRFLWHDRLLLLKCQPTVSPEDFGGDFSRIFE